MHDMPQSAPEDDSTGPQGSWQHSQRVSGTTELFFSVSQNLGAGRRASEPESVASVTQPSQPETCSGSAVTGCRVNDS